MSILNLECYEQIGDVSKRIGIIVTDDTILDDELKNALQQDVQLIKTLLRNLKFHDDNIKIIENEASNVVTLEIVKYCTTKDAVSDGYIVLFNLTPKTSSTDYYTGGYSYTLKPILETFAMNYLTNFAFKPKLIFNQNPLVRNPDPKKPRKNYDSGTFEIIKYSIDRDIFESFANCGEENWFGNSTGSHYIQILCKTINELIDDEGTLYNTTLTDIMYKVHGEIHKLAGGSQTPFIRSTFPKSFKFPK